MKAILHLRQAFGFLTVLPGHGRPGPGARIAFPVVGAVVGLAVGGVRWGAGAWWTPLVAAVLAVGTDAALTGMLHLDGLADSADGLLAPMDRSRRLAVMATPDVGAFAVVVVGVVLALQVAALASLPRDLDTVVGVAAVWATSRAVMAVVPAVVPYARTGGLASAFLGAGARGAAVLGVVVVGVLAVIGDVLRVGAASAGCVLGAGAVVVLARRRLGGFTGDVLGASGVVGATVGLLVLAARP